MGGKNPIEDLGVLKSLQRIVALAEIQISDDEKYKTHRCMYKKFLAQESGRDNWQHGQVYASFSKHKATEYARDNEYGSELITETLRLYKKLTDTSSLISEENPILNLIGSKNSPLIIKVENYPISSLQPEKKGSLEESLKRLSEDDQHIFDAVHTQSIHFRLLTPVPYSEFTVEEL